MSTGVGHALAVFGVRRNANFLLFLLAYRFAQIKRQGKVAVEAGKIHVVSFGKNIGEREVERKGRKLHAYLNTQLRQKKRGPLLDGADSLQLLLFDIERCFTFGVSQMVEPKSQPSTKVFVVVHQARLHKHPCDLKS